jgi:hypothetical protein
MLKPDGYTSQRAFLAHALHNDADAVDFCERIFGISQTLDDIVDEPHKAGANTVGAMVIEALIGIQTNKFYFAHFGQLAPVIQAAYFDWHAATELETTGKQHELRLSYALRDSLTRQVVVACAQIVGGFEWAQAVNSEITLATYDETFEDYSKEHIDVG